MVHFFNFLAEERQLEFRNGCLVGKSITLPWFCRCQALGSIIRVEATAFGNPHRWLYSLFLAWAGYCLLLCPYHGLILYRQVLELPLDDRLTALPVFDALSQHCA